MFSLLQKYSIQYEKLDSRWKIQKAKTQARKTDTETGDTFHIFSPLSLCLFTDNGGFSVVVWKLSSFGQNHQA